MRLECRATGPLCGSWAAVSWEYERREDGRRIDVVGDLGGSVTLSLTDERFVLSWHDGRNGPRSRGGSLGVATDAWLDFAAPDGTAERIGFRRADDTLVLRGEHSAWDFDGNGATPAEFTAVMVRL
jgi:hypothetical protein